METFWYRLTKVHLEGQLKHTERVIVQFYCQTVGAGNRRFNVGVLFDRTTVDILTALQLTTLSAKLQET